MYNRQVQLHSKPTLGSPQRELRIPHKKKKAILKQKTRGIHSRLL
jgi:hypothetical protein